MPHRLLQSSSSQLGCVMPFLPSIHIAGLPQAARSQHSMLAPPTTVRAASQLVDATLPASSHVAALLGSAARLLETYSVDGA